MLKPEEQAVEASRRDASTADHLSNARQHLAAAKEMVNQMSAGRRQPEADARRREMDALYISN